MQCPHGRVQPRLTGYLSIDRRASLPPVPGRIGEAVFIVGSPASGGSPLAQSLARASGIWHPTVTDFLGEARERAGSLGARGHALTAEDADGDAAEIRGALADILADREGRPLGDGEGAELAVAWSPRSALRIPFLARAFPGCRFVLCTRDPAAAMTDMLGFWRSRRMVSAPDLPGWDGPPWSLPLIPGWSTLRGRPLEQVVVAQWRELVQRAVTELEQLPADRWALSDFGALLEHPREELRRLCDFLGITYDQAVLTPVEAARRRLDAGSVEPPPELLELIDQTHPVTARLHELQAPARSSGRTAMRADTASPFRSTFTGSFARVLSEIGGSLLISTYQSGRLICARVSGGMLNTHLRSFDKPMGIAAARDRFALGTRTEVWDFRNMPAVAPKIDPAGSHDACYLPQNRHLTGDILVHELAYDRTGELWGVATAFSTLVTFDRDSSFVPRWRPPFISELAPGDRCHLNGLCMKDGQVTFVTALGRSDTPGGWRKNKSSGGCLLDVASGEPVVEGLSMPHSPRWHDGRLWLLESGRGELVTVDVDTGTTETVAELPGFTRGLAVSGHLAFVGLSQIRESSTFGDLPLTQRLDERVCGVWIVDLSSGEAVGLLRFDDFVQEIFDVAVLPGVRYPEIAETSSSAAATSFVLG